jgi:hypothetical protein
MCATSVNFNKQPKVNKDPKGRKLAQSGHPAPNPSRNFLTRVINERFFSTKLISKFNLKIRATLDGAAEEKILLEAK